MVTQLKAAKRKLDEAMITGEELNPDVKHSLETKAAFLHEYNSLSLFDSKKEQMLQAWKTDKTLKQWAESKTTHQSSTSVFQEEAGELRDQAARPYFVIVLLLASL